MNAMIVSDLHIGSHYFRFGIFERFLEALPADHDLIMNGDIIDSPYAKMQPSDQHVLDMIKEISYRQKVVWIRGNHDNGYVPQDYGAAIFKRQYAIGKRLLITHGDDFDDIMPHSRLFIKAFKLMHKLRVKFGAKPVHVAEYAKKWKSLYRILRKNVALNAVKSAAENGFAAVACGHTHYPEDLKINGIRYINTGAWTELPAYYLQITAEEMVLSQVNPSILSHHGKSAISTQHKSAINLTEAIHLPAEIANENFKSQAPNYK